jgi:hypothetical protein
MTLEMVKTDITPVSSKSKSVNDNAMRLEAQLIFEWKGKEGQLEKPVTIGIPAELKFGISSSGNDNAHVRGTGPRSIVLDGKTYDLYFSGNVTIPNLFGHSAKKQ